MLCFLLFVGWNSAVYLWFQHFFLLMSRVRQDKVLKIFISSLNLSQELQAANWILPLECLNKHLKFNMSKNQALDLVLSTCLSCSFSSLRKWQLHPLRCLGPKPGSIFLFFCLSFLMSNPSGNPVGSIFQNISRIQSPLITSTTTILVQVSIISYLDYCNNLLNSHPW